jgi:hypothetical protein
MSAKKAYNEKLKDPRWQKKRLLIFDRDNWTCQCCGDKEMTLNVHHTAYVGDPWDCPDEKLVTVCEDCHEIITMQVLDLITDLVEIRKLPRPTHISYFCISAEGVMLFMKQPGKKIECYGGASHEILKHIIHDVINYWLKTDQDHYLTEKLTPTHG